MKLRLLRTTGNGHRSLMHYHDWLGPVREFLRASGFRRGGGIVTDLDGTAVHEHAGRVRIEEGVARALKRLDDQGRAIVINTLRFPLNVIATFGSEWAEITDARLPLVSLNGSLTGYLAKDEAGLLIFEEIDACPLGAAEIAEVMTGVEGLIRNEIDNLLLFYYPRDWRLGEFVWTPVAERVREVRAKFVSSSEVFTSGAPELAARLRAAEPCMIFLLIDRPADDKMAYQHFKPSNFITAARVDKRHGLRRLARELAIDLDACAGAGDTPMDNFLCDTGLAIHVGPLDLEFRGQRETIRIADSAELGRVLHALGGGDEAP